MVPSRIQLFTSLLWVAPLASVAGGDARRLPAVHRPDPGRSWFHRGAITLGGPPCKRNAEDYHRASRTEPQNAAVARCLALKEGGSSGVAAASRWTQLDPENFDAWIFRAVVGKDLQAARQALWLRPLDADAWNLVGSLCADAGCARGLGRDAFRTAVRLRPDFGEAWVNLAGAGNVTYGPEEALETRHAAAEGARLVPDAPFAWMFLGHSAFAGVRSIGDNEDARSRWREAAEAYVKVVELEPSERHWHMLSQALSSARDSALSTRLRARLTRINPVKAKRLP